MDEISEEQNEVLSAVNSGFSVKCDSVAGSGKTTTILHLARNIPKCKFLQLTYNAALKLEVRKKSKDLLNLEVHSYHSFATTYYNGTAYTDDKIDIIIKTDQKAKKKFNFDVIVVDESQDMTPLLYRLFKKIIADMGNKNVQLLFMGDKNQSVYQFKGADYRFLTKADTLTGKDMKNLRLSTSYRVPQPIAWFVNSVMLKMPDFIVPHCKSGPPILYVRHYNPMAVKILSDAAIDLLKSGEILPGDIYVIRASLKSPSGVHVDLENIFVHNGYPCFVTKEYGAKDSTDLHDGKIVFTTFHQSKGLERKLVIVLGFDNGYFERFARDTDPGTCPSTLYVGVTRSSKYLFIHESLYDGPLPFLNYGLIEHSKYIDFRTGHRNMIKKATKHVRTTKVTELIKFIDGDRLVECTRITDSLFSTLLEPSKNTQLTSVVTFNGKPEDVSFINGLAIPSAWHDTRKGVNVLMETIKKFKELPCANDKKTADYIMSHIARLREEGESPSDYLQQAVIYWSISENLIHYLAQIKTYDWLNAEQLLECYEVLDSCVTGDIEMEVEIEISSENSRMQKKIAGYFSDDYDSFYELYGVIDAISEETLWELKCVNSFNLEHKLQLIVYAWLWHNLREKDFGERVFNLLNIRTFEVINLYYDEDKIEQLMGILFRNRFKETIKISDEEFLANNV